MRMKRLALLVPVLPLLLLSACGGSDDDQVSAGLSKADYIAKAEAICSTANKEIDALPAPTSIAAVQGLVEESVKIAEAATDKIKDLDPPASDRADLKAKVLDPLDGQVTDGKEFLAKVKDAVAKNDQAALGQLLADPPRDSKADLDWMRGYGFKECVKAADTEG